MIVQPIIRNSFSTERTFFPRLFVFDEMECRQLTHRKLFQSNAHHVLRGRSNSTDAIHIFNDDGDNGVFSQDCVELRNTI